MSLNLSSFSFYVWCCKQGLLERVKWWGWCEHRQPTLCLCCVRGSHTYSSTAYFFHVSFCYNTTNYVCLSLILKLFPQILYLYCSCNLYFLISILERRILKRHRVAKNHFPLRNPNIFCSVSEDLFMYIFPPFIFLSHFSVVTLILVN